MTAIPVRMSARMVSLIIVGLACMAPTQYASAQVGFAVRTLRRSPGFTVVAVSTIGLCMGANAAIFTIVDAATLPLRWSS